MREIEHGHVYELANLKESGLTILQFHRDAAIHGYGMTGPSTQEVLRACIARVMALDSEKPHPVNGSIIEHLRQAILLFEFRALEKKVANGLAVENWPVGCDGHILTQPSHPATPPNHER